MNKQLVFKLVGVVVPVLVAIAGMVYGDVTPMVHDLCGALLPSGSMKAPPAGDAGAAR